MKNLIAILILFCAFSASAAQRITATITATNAAVTGDGLTVNSSFRFFTNANSSSTILTNLVGKNQTATNLYNQIAAYPYTGPIAIRYASTNQIQLIGALDGALAVSVAGTWATVSLSTQSGPQTYTALWPIENIVAATNRTNQASAFVGGLSTYSTNAFATNSTALSNHITKGASPPQYITSELRLSGNLNNGTSELSVSNLANRGNAIRSFGSGGNSFQAGSNATASGSRSLSVGNSSTSSGTDSAVVGTSATATGTDSIAFGTSALASNNYTVAIGTSSKATNTYSMAIGNGSIAGGGSDALAIGRSAQALGSSAMSIGQGGIAQGTAALAIQSEVVGDNSIGIGPSSSVSATNSTALGTGATVTHNDSTALGKNATSTTTNQIRLGTSSETVSVPGVLEVSGTQSSTVFDGTNKFNLAISLSVTNITSLANGANDVDPGLKTYIKVSGPTAAYSIDKIDRGYDGRILTIQKTDSYTMTVINNSGAGVLGDTAKILTGTGGTLTITNNPGFVQLIYDAGASRWGVINKSN